jgi:crossover junction endodeoxyribonuclease RuvC
VSTIVAIDPSLTATAVCLIHYGQPEVAVSRTKPRGKLTVDKLDRMHAQTAFVAEYAELADLILIEAPSFGSMGSATRDLAGLWWLLFDTLTSYPAPIGVVAPSALKKWATGAGNADKFRVGQHIGKRWPDLELRSDDEADALGLASMGLQHVGELPWTPTAFQVEALGKVEWNNQPVLGVAS